MVRPAPRVTFRNVARAAPLATDEMRRGWPGRCSSKTRIRDEGTCADNHGHGNRDHDPKQIGPSERSLSVGYRCPRLRRTACGLLLRHTHSSCVTNDGRPVGPIRGIGRWSERRQRPAAAHRTGMGVKYGYDDKGKPMLTKEPKLYAAFGNSVGDRQQLEYTKSGPGARLVMLVFHDDANANMPMALRRGWPGRHQGRNLHAGAV